jgi:hypothetical protein
MDPAPTGIIQRMEPVIQARRNQTGFFAGDHAQSRMPHSLPVFPDFLDESILLDISPIISLSP